MEVQVYEIDLLIFLFKKQPKVHKFCG